MTTRAHRRILLIEDNLVIATVVKRCCERSAHYVEISVASDGLLGYQQACKDLPDLIMLDMMMPGCDGIDFLNLYKDEGKLKEVPVLICSALDKRELAEIQAAYPMVKAVIEKPVTPSKIMELIRTYVPFSPGRSPDKEGKTETEK